MSDETRVSKADLCPLYLSMHYHTPALLLQVLGLLLMFQFQQMGYFRFAGQLLGLPDLKPSKLSFITVRNCQIMVIKGK